MKTILTGLAVLMVLVLGAWGNGIRPQSVQVAHAASVPAGLPSHFGIGLAAQPSSDGIYGWMPNTGIPWDYAYQYLSGGANTGSGWSTWNANGQFALSYATGSASHGYIPVFSYYQLLQSSGTCASCGESQKDLSNLNNSSLMASYFADFRLLMQRLGSGTYGSITGFGKRAIVQVEPDLSGYAQQAVLNSSQCFGYCSAQGNNPANLRASVASSRDSDVQGIPNTFQGFNWALLHLRDLYAPNVLLAIHVSNWAAGQDIGSSHSTTLDATALGQQVGSFAAQSGITGVPSGSSTYDLIFNDASDRDAGLYKYLWNNPNNWWDRTNTVFPNFHRWESFLTSIHQAANRPFMIWQIPLGNQYFQTENNTAGHYQDNRAEYFFGHIQELAQLNIIGLLFGSGGSSATTNTDAAKDGISNPPSFCTTDGTDGITRICNSHVSTVADDDGGYIRMQAQAYYANPYPLNGSSTPPTSTPVVPTKTPGPTTTVASPTATVSSGGSAVRFDFEDGTSQGWSLNWGTTVAVANTTSVAYNGSHSLALNVTGTGWPGVYATSGLSGLASGSTVTYHVYSPAGSGISAAPYACDGAWATHFAATSPTLAAGWNTVTWQIPMQTGLQCIGMQINDGNGWSGQLALDAVSWSAGAPSVTSTPSPPTSTAVPPTKIPVTATNTPIAPMKTAVPTATTAPATSLIIGNFENVTDGFSHNTGITAMAPSTTSGTVAMGTYSLGTTYSVTQAWTELQVYKVADLNLSTYSTLSASIFANQPTATGAGVKVRFLVQGSDNNWYGSPYQSVAIGTRSTVSWALGTVPRAPIHQLYICWQYTTSPTGTGNQLWVDAVRAS